MAEKRRKFSPEFRDEAVKMVVNSQPSRPVAQVARELGVNEGTLANWVAQYRKKHPVDGEPLTVSERARLRELERENQELRMRAEFLNAVSCWPQRPLGKNGGRMGGGHPGSAGPDRTQPDPA